MGKVLALLGAAAAISMVGLTGCTRKSPSLVPTQVCAQLRTQGLAIDWTSNRISSLPRAYDVKLALAGACGQPGAARTPVPVGGSAASPTTPNLPPPGRTPPTVNGNQGPNVDWDFTAAGPVNASAAMWTPDYPNRNDANDALYFGTTNGTFYKLTGLYKTAPTVAWSKSTAGLDGSAVVLSIDGQKIYALDKSGTLYCFAAADGSTCAGWTNTTFGAVSWSSPWLDYTTGDLYFASTNTNLYKVGPDGKQVWAAPLGSSSHSSPVALSGYVFVGNNAGSLLRITDSGTSYGAIASASLAGPVYGGVSADLSINALFIAAGGSVYQFPSSGASPWSGTSVSLGTPSGATLYSSAIPDLTAKMLYVGYNNEVFKVAYPITGSSAVAATSLGFAGASGSYPKSSPVMYYPSMSSEGKVYVGDGGGHAEELGCPLASGAPSLQGITMKYGATVDGTPVVDYATGNILFGYDKGDGTGGMVQITQTGTGWGCGGGGLVACANSVCSSTESACIAACNLPTGPVWMASGGSNTQTGLTLGISLGNTISSNLLVTGTGQLTLGYLASDTY